MYTYPLTPEQFPPGSRFFLYKPDEYFASYYHYYQVVLPDGRVPAFARPSGPLTCMGVSDASEHHDPARPDEFTLYFSPPQWQEVTAVGFCLVVNAPCEGGTVPDRSPPIRLEMLLEHRVPEYRPFSIRMSHHALRANHKLGAPKGKLP